MGEIFFIFGDSLYIVYKIIVDETLNQRSKAFFSLFASIFLHFCSLRFEFFFLGLDRKSVV